MTREEIEKHRQYQLTGAAIDYCRKEDKRYEIVYNLYPKFYETFMNYTNNGVTYREALRKVLAANKLFLPDEQPQLTLFE